MQNHTLGKIRYRLSMETPAPISLCATRQFTTPPPLKETMGLVLIPIVMQQINYNCVNNVKNTKKTHVKFILTYFVLFLWDSMYAFKMTIWTVTGVNLMI